MEIWKDIKYLEGYQVSNFGRVRSIGNNKSRKTKILKTSDCRGYLQVKLYKDKKGYSFLVHRLVAEAFIPNHYNLSQVNHKDEDKHNNFAGTPENNFTDGNLEWCDAKYNSNYGTRIKRCSEKKINGKLSKEVLQYSKSGCFIKKWPSLKEIERKTGLNHTSIGDCCRGKQKSSHGFVWKFKKEVV